jgi:hypothetical protein
VRAPSALGFGGTLTVTSHLARLRTESYRKLRIPNRISSGKRNRFHVVSTILGRFLAFPTIPRSMASPCSRFPGGFRRLGYPGFAPTVSRIAGSSIRRHAKRHLRKAFVEIGAQVRRSQVDLPQLGSARGRMRFRGQFTSNGTDDGSGQSSGGCPPGAVSDLLRCNLE